MNKNYIIYEHEDKIKRQPISSKDIYPFYTAYMKLPEECYVIAVIVTKPCDQCTHSTFLKHSLIGLDEDIEVWRENQKKFEGQMLPLLKAEEQELLKPKG